VVRYLTRHHSRRVAHAVLIAPTTPFSMKTTTIQSERPRGSRKDLESLKHDLRTSLQRRRRISSASPKTPFSTETMDWWCRMFLDRCSIKCSRTFSS